MPLSLWYVFPPIPRLHHNTYFAQTLSKHKMLERNIGKYYYI